MHCICINLLFSEDVYLNSNSNITFQLYVYFVTLLLFKDKHEYRFVCMLHTYTHV